MPKKASKTTKAKSPKSSTKAVAAGPWLTFFRVTALLLDIVAVAALCLTAYSGMLSPLSHSALWGVFPLAFPIVVTAVVVLALSQIVWHWRGVIVCAAGLVACAMPVFDFCPLNITTPKVPQGAQEFTLMSYNAHQFMPPHVNAMPPGEGNAQLQYVLDSGADIVCLQEASYLFTGGRNAPPADMVAELHRRYPTVLFSVDELVLLSKFPAEAIHLDVSRKNFPGGTAACYRVTLPSGRLVTVFNVHMASMTMNEGDVEVSRNLTELKHEDLGALKSQLLGKLCMAARNRARQVQQLQRWIRLYGGPDVIVTGDFNDAPGCYALRNLSDTGFRSVYPEVGFGPMITFNSDRMYFRIDHTLYRGALRPVWMHKGSLRASDHYPLTTLFYIAD